ncbi:MAG: DUF6263 family protein [Bacteroidota bacterium]
MKKLIFVLVCLFVVKGLQAQQINIKTGNEFTVETDSKYTIQLDDRRPEKTNDKITFVFTVLNNNSEGYKLKCTIVKLKMRYDRSDLFLFDSDSIRKTSTRSSGVLIPFSLLEQPFTVVLSPNGKLLRIEGINELIKRSFAKWHVWENSQQYIASAAPELISSTIKNIFLELPKEKIAYQSAWTNNALGTNYKVTTIAGSLLTITATAMDTLKAKYTLNDVNGLLENASITFKKTSTDGRVTEWRDYSHKVIYDKHVVASVDTAWIDMAMNLSYWNQTLRPTTDHHVDSATAFGYFKKYDAIYKDDSSYVIQKVSLINQMGKAKDGIYRKLVLETPNKFLAETELINKMNYVMDTDIDQIYDFVKYRSKSPAFDSWVQGSLADRLLSAVSDDERIQDLMNKGYTKAKAFEIAATQDRNFANSNLLIERMHNDPDPLIRQKVEAMYLWINAFHHNKNIPFLVKTARQFNKLNDDYMKVGYGGRYGLALYGLMADAGIKEQAEQVLNKTIADMEKYLTDTAYYNKNYAAIRAKSSAREVLMIGYNIKYQQTNLTDSTKALTYLAKAAIYSPLNVNEQSNEISADRMLFLASGINSKPSYRKAYIQKLFAAGDNKEGMNLFAANINADLGSLNEMQKIYQQRFPDKSFSDLVKNNIIANWQEAPGFSVNDIKGKTYSLTDYKGKWLVIDFWGTWCPPCRAEMPEIEEFNKEINDGKHPGISLLGVMAYDTEKTLTQYFKETKATLNCVLDKDAFSQYEFPAVPTKCLVAPNGKMIKLPLGVNWKVVVTKLNELYAAN